MILHEYTEGRFLSQTLCVIDSTLKFWMNRRAFSFQSIFQIPFHFMFVGYDFCICWVICHPGGCVRQWISAWGQGTGYLGSSKSTRMVIHSFLPPSMATFYFFLNVLSFYERGMFLFVSVLICIDIMLKHAQSLYLSIYDTNSPTVPSALRVKKPWLSYFCVYYTLQLLPVFCLRILPVLSPGRDFVWVVYLSIILFFSTSLISAVFINTISWLFCCFVLLCLWMYWMTTSIVN